MKDGNQYLKDLKDEKKKRTTYKTYKRKDVFEGKDLKNKNKVISKVKKNK